MSRLRKDIEALTLQRKRAKDYDPEDEENDRGSANGDSQSDDSDQKENANAGREHYEQVGKSRLRQPEVLDLGSKYGGVAVSRQAINDGLSDDEDPFAAGIEQDGESSGDGNESDEFDSVSQQSEESSTVQDTDLNGVRLHNAPSSIVSDDDSDAELSASDAEDDEDMKDEDMKDEDDASATSNSQSQAQLNDKRQQSREILRAQQQALSTGLASSLNADVKKGRAVRRQRLAFDRALDARMKLQRGFVAVSDLGLRQPLLEMDHQAEAALTAAKQAALQLFNDISTFRNTIKATNENGNLQGQKRKREGKSTANSDVNDQWRVLVDLERDTLPSHQITIDKWSARIKSADPSQAAAASKSSVLDPEGSQRKLTAVIDTFVINEFDKLSQSSIVKDQLIDLVNTYDDTAFYQSLLRDLIASRSAMSTAASNMSASLLPPKLHPSGNTNNKRAIDTKASKGRKIRYTVHEKLQNFMAAEGDAGRNTAMWTERGKDEFFGSLFGQDRALHEDDNVDTTNEDGVASEREALRLFAAQ